MTPNSERDVFLGLAAFVGFLVLFFVISTIRKQPETSSQDQTNPPVAESNPGPPPPVWDKPDTFAGLKFGEDLTKQIVACSPTKISGPGNTPCYRRLYEERFDLYNLISLPGVYRIEANQLNHKLFRIVLQFRTNKAPELLLILNQKYGPPTRASTKPWELNGMATGITSYEAQWTNTVVTLGFYERDWRIDRGQVVYQTLESIERERKKAEAAEPIRKGAGGL